MRALRPISQPIPYTSSPWLLAVQDLWLFISVTLVWPVTNSLPSIVLPILPYESGPLDELYPTASNLWALSIHSFLLIVQAMFLLLLVPSLCLGVPLPLLAWTPASIIIMIALVIGNEYFCILLNGTKRQFESISNPPWQEKWTEHEDEKWVFINGVAVGSHWMQSNLDRLALTFRRPIRGIHNRSQGILFDTIECIVQRTFGYATADIREIYATMMSLLEAEKSEMAKYKKIVLIMHSQGAIEGSLVLDWLFATADQELLEKLEVYTFGAAANHFNSPDRGGKRLVEHMEHYANLGDWVSNFGILHFRPLPKHGNKAYDDQQAREKVQNRYVGRMFARKGSGHMMNGHYLDNFFEMTTDGEGRLVKVKDDNGYMSGKLNEKLLQDYEIAGKETEKDVWDCASEDKDCAEGKAQKARKIMSVSRLWHYRNGMSPDDLKKASTI